MLALPRMRKESRVPFSLLSDLTRRERPPGTELPVGGSYRSEPEKRGRSGLRDGDGVIRTRTPVLRLSDDVQQDKS